MLTSLSLLINGNINFQINYLEAYLVSIHNYKLVVMPTPSIDEVQIKK
jgi:hypothetical protein